MSERPVKKYGYALTISREVALESGVIPPTPEEVARWEEQERQWAKRKPKAIAETETFVAALSTITRQPSRAVLDLHSADPANECRGCDFAGYEGEPPPWPCRTVEAIAAHHGITTPDLLLFE